jgi:hypothetical protein
MRRMVAGFWVGVSSAVCLAGLAGCTSYYKVHDPTTGKDYYTTDLQKKSSGASTLKDARTGNTVNLQNSEIEEIKKEEFESGKHAAQLPATPGPAADATK